MMSALTYCYRRPDLLQGADQYRRIEYRHAYIKPIHTFNPVGCAKKSHAVACGAALRGAIRSSAFKEASRWLVGTPVPF
ncbi:hypothetical protein D3C72_1582530 [compost metagenome]